MKRCSKCGEDKPLSLYGVNNSQPDRLSTQCKDCRRAYRIANLDVIRAKDRRWYLANQERIKERMRRYAQERRPARAERVVVSEPETGPRVTPLLPHEALSHLRVTGQALSQARIRGSIGGVDLDRGKTKYAYPPAEVARFALAQMRFDSMLGEYQDSAAHPAHAIIAASGLAYAVLRVTKIFEVGVTDRDCVVLVLTRAGVSHDDAQLAWSACGKLVQDIHSPLLIAAAKSKSQER